MEKSADRHKKVILLGLDGATYDVLLPWIEEGIMPNLKKLLETASWGDLESTIPATTPPAWSSAVTGKNPGKHGIFDFRESFFLDRSRPLVSSKSLKTMKIWHILNSLGKTAGIMNVPITYPPEKVDGFMISGAMTPSSDSPYMYPPELKQKLISAIGDYIPNIDIPKYDVEILEDAMRFFDDIQYSYRKREEAFFYLLDEYKPDFAMPVFILPDRIGHLFWKYLFPESTFYNSPNGPAIREKIFESFRLMDGIFEKLMKRLDRNTVLFLMSDHGFGYTKKWINVNRFLMDEGYLALKQAESWKKSVFFTIMKWNDSPLVKSIVPNKLQSTIRGKIRAGRSTFKTDVDSTIDWSKTRAFFASIPCQGVYINVEKDGGGVVKQGREYDLLRTEIKEKLQKMEDPETGKPVMDNVFYREELYRGPYTDMAPDIIFIAQQYAYLGRQLFGSKTWIETSENLPNGFHRHNGIFAAVGDHIKKNFKVEKAHIMDIMPTVLYTMGIPIPDDIDGKVLRKIYEDSYIKENKPQYRKASDYKLKEGEEVYSEEDSEKITERLKGLGYIE
jgi:predicted AlkP superfamily phosphohydrolase/phosphomutase